MGRWSKKQMATEGIFRKIAKIVTFEVLNRSASTPCRRCGARYNHHVDNDVCSCCGRGVTNCPKCGCPAREPLNSESKGPK
jgi:hypothetical protein